MDISGLTGAAGGLFMTVMKVLMFGVVALIGFFGTRFYIKHLRFFIEELLIHLKI